MTSRTNWVPKIDLTQIGKFTPNLSFLDGVSTVNVKKLSWFSASFLAKTLYISALLAVCMKNTTLVVAMLGTMILDVVVSMAAYKQKNTTIMLFFLLYATITAFIAATTESYLVAFLFGIWISWSSFQALEAAEQRYKTLNTAYLLRNLLMVSTFVLLWYSSFDTKILRGALLLAIWLADPNPMYPDLRLGRPKIKVKHWVRILGWLSISTVIIYTGYLWEGLVVFSWVGLGLFGYLLHKPQDNPRAQSPPVHRKRKQPVRPPQTVS